MNPSVSLPRILCALALLIGLGAVAAPPARALDLIPNFFKKEPDGTVIWEAGNQYVRMVEQEDVQDGPNQHPVTLPVGQLAQALSALTLNKSAGFLSRDTEPLPVLVPSEVSDLSATISRGLAEARPDQELIFVVIGMHRGTFAKERMAVGGRVFYKDDKLNIILGDVHKPLRAPSNSAAAQGGDANTDIDLRVDPVKIGSRTKETKLSAAVSTLEGLDFRKKSDTLPRGDWLMIDIPKVLAGIQKGQDSASGSATAERNRMQLEAQKLAQERRQMREEMARMRKEMKEAGGGGTSGASLEQRLATLDELRAKELISEQEYEVKRKEILDDI